MNLIEQMEAIAAEILEREAKDCEELVKKLDEVILKAYEQQNQKQDSYQSA